MLLGFHSQSPKTYGQRSQGRIAHLLEMLAASKTDNTGPSDSRPCHRIRTQRPCCCSDRTPLQLPRRPEAATQPHLEEVRDIRKQLVCLRSKRCPESGRPLSCRCCTPRVTAPGTMPIPRRGRWNHRARRPPCHRELRLPCHRAGSRRRRAQRPCSNSRPYPSASARKPCLSASVQPVPIEAPTSIGSSLRRARRVRSGIRPE